jgi:hypothetical protein
MSGCARCGRAHIKARGMCASCYDKWRRQVRKVEPPHTSYCGGCRHDVKLTQTCAVCRRKLCPSCYGEWLGLSCEGCQLAAAFAMRKEA